MKQYLFLLILFFLFSTVKSQSYKAGVKYWSNKNRLAAEDFIIYKAPDSIHTCEINIEIKFYGYISRQPSKERINRSVLNFMFDNSWIDTNFNFQAQLNFMQAMFDLGEVNARRLRKELFALGKFTSNSIKKTTKKFYTECKLEFNKMELETNYGNEIDKLNLWIVKIKKELSELSDFAIDETLL